MSEEHTQVGERVSFWTSSTCFLHNICQHCSALIDLGMAAANLFSRSDFFLLSEDSKFQIVTKNEKDQELSKAVMESIKTLRSMGYFRSSKLLVDNLTIPMFCGGEGASDSPLWFSIVDPEDTKLTGLSQVIKKLNSSLGTMKSFLKLSDNVIMELSIDVSYCFLKWILR